MRRPIRPLYVMLKPPTPVAGHIHGLPWADRARSAALLHVTVLAICDAGDLSASMVREVAQRLRTMRIAPFRVVFDRVVANRRCATLIASEPLPQVSALRNAAISALGLDRRGFPEQRFRPHVTLNYRCAASGDLAIDPVSWMVAEASLIESVHGAGRHIEHARFPLMPLMAAPMRAA